MNQPAGLWHDARALNAGANALIALALAGLLAVGAYRIAGLPEFRLRSVTIRATPGTELLHVSGPLLRATVLRGLKGTFFTVDLDAVRAAFDAVPWVRSATVRRIWPDRLLVTIEERRPIALWGDGRAMDVTGELFPANLAEVEEQGPLPQLSGPAGSEQSVLARYRELGQWLAPLQLKPVAVALSDRWAWSARLDDGTTLLLGRDQGLPIEERVRRWVAVYPRVEGRLDQRASVIDLRYPNGFAVRSASAARESAQPGAATLGKAAYRQ